MSEESKEILSILENPKFREHLIYDQHSDYWAKWLDEHPEKSEYFKIAKRIFSELNSVEPSWSEHAEYALKSRIIRHVENHHYTKKTPNKKYAAVVLSFLALVALAVFVPYFGRVFEVSKHHESSVSSSRNSPRPISKSSPAGQKTRIFLPDGSRVTLNSESEVVYSDSFSLVSREIFLKGEAFFEVAPDSTLPFRVHTGNLTTEALGTSFGITAYTEDKLVVKLATGRVMVKYEDDGNNSAVLTPGLQLVTTEKNSFDVSDFDTSSAFAWMSGIIIFENQGWHEVIPYLERWYGVEITVKGSFPKKQKVTGQFNNDLLSNVLNSLSFAYGFGYEIDKKNIIITFN